MADLVFDLNKPGMAAGSESPDGDPINLNGATTPGSSILLHRATSEPDEWDEVYVFGSNLAAAGSKFIGVVVGAQDLAHTLAVTINFATTQLLAGPFLLRGGKSVWAYSSTAPASEVNVFTRYYRHKGEARAPAA